MSITTSPSMESGVSKSELHGDLAAHGVADQLGVIDLLARKKFAEISRHVGIIHGWIMR